MKSGFFHIFGANALNRVIIFISGVILVRVISKTAYGIYTYTNNILQFFLLFSGFGIVSAILQVSSENSRNADKSDSIYSFGFKFGVLVNIILSLIVIIFALFVPLKIEGSNQLLLLMSIYPVFTIVIDLIKIFFRYKKKNKSFSYSTSINTISVLAFSILGAIILQEKGLVIFRYIGVFLSIVLSIILFKFPIRMIFKKIKLSKEDRKDLFKISSISMANNATSHLVYLIDIFVIGILITNEEVIASYKVSTIIPNAMIFIPMSLMVFFYPVFAENKDNLLFVKRTYRKIILYFGLLNLSIVGISLLLSEYIILLIFGNPYLDSVAIFRVLLIGYFITSTFRTISGTILLTQRKLLFNLIMGISEGVLNVVINILLIPSMGAMGAAIASVSVVAVTSVISYLYLSKLLNKRTI